MYSHLCTSSAEQSCLLRTVTVSHLLPPPSLEATQHGCGDLYVPPRTQVLVAARAKGDGCLHTVPFGSRAPASRAPASRQGQCRCGVPLVPRRAAPQQQCTPSHSPHMPRCTADRVSMQAYTWTLLPRGAWQCTPGQCCICDHHGLLMPPCCGLRGAGCPRKCGHAHQGQYRVAEHTHCLCLGTCALLRGSVRDNRLLCLRGGGSPLHQG